MVNKRIWVAILTCLTILGLMLPQAVPASADTGWFDSTWPYRKAITIDHTKVFNTDQANFPVLISTTDTDWKDTTNGGHVAQADGGDIVFTSADGITKLSHEIEKYVPSTGELISWVKIPALSATTDTVIYIYYGNAACTNQWNPTGVWDSNFKMVQHFKETSGTHYDSTSNANNGTPNGGVTQGVAGTIDGANTFDGSNDYIQTSLASFPSTFTAEAWIKPAVEMANAIMGTAHAAHPDASHAWIGVVPKLYFSYDPWTWGAGQYQTDSAVITTNQWNHIAVSFTFGTGTSMKMYVNGVLVPGSWFAGDANSVQTWAGAGIKIGALLVTGYPLYFNGTIDEARMSDTIRSADWIKTEYNNQNSPATFYSFGNEQAGDWKPFGIWPYRKAITIDHTKVSNTDQANFPVLISRTDNDWKDTANGGYVAQADGGDIVFTSYDGTTQLSHEIEKYTPSTGELISWVKVPTLSASANTVIYIYYGNATCADQWAIDGSTWDPNFKMVQHLKETSRTAGAYNDHLDSTSNNNNGEAMAGVTMGATGKINGADTFSQAANNYVDSGNNASLNIIDNITVEAWIYPTANMANNAIIAKQHQTNVPQYALLIHTGGAISFQIWDGSSWKRATGGVPSLNTWHHVVGVYNKSNVKVYLDGAETIGDAYNGSMPSTTAYVSVGDYHSYDGTYAFVGTIDEARISATARSGDWIKTEHNNQSSPATFYTIGSEETPVAETISAPNAPTGPASGMAGTSLSYSIGGATSNLGHAVQYKFDWGDDTYSSWGTETTTSHIYTDNGTYQIKAQARCAADTAIVSAWSSAKSVVITAAAYAGPNWYVSPTGDDTSGDGSETAPYKTIGKAVTQASDEHIIKVMDDNITATDDYVENITVNKSLTIERYNDTGANPQVKADNAGGDVFNVTADNVTIRGLDIYGATGDSSAGIALAGSGCTVSSNRCGWDSDHKNYYGIRLVSSSDNTISGNIANSNQYGIFLESSSNNTISGNTTNSDSIGIKMLNSSNNTVSGNTTGSNSTAGIYLDCCSNSNNTVSGNTCSSNYSYGIVLYSSSNNTISGNTANSNGEYGIVLDSSSNNTISGNTCSLNTHGIHVQQSSNNNTISGNTCSSSTEAGILLESSSNNNIYLNSLSNTSNVSSTDSGNIWESPTRLAYKFDGQSFKSFMGNYFSDYAGADANGDGIGDTEYATGGGVGDFYPLKQARTDYELQTWYLTNPTMFKNDMTKSGGTVNIAASGNVIWKSDTAVTSETVFPAGMMADSTSWTGQMVIESAPANGDTFTIQIGYSTDGTDFTAGGAQATLTGDDTKTVFTYTTNSAAVTVPNGKYLALKITNNSASDYPVRTGGSWSYVSAPLGEAPPAYTLTINKVGGGITDPSVGAHIYVAGQVVPIVATPAGGWYFDCWTGDVANSLSRSTTVTVSANKTVTANFAETPPLTGRIAFSYTPDGGNYDIYMMNADGTNLTRLTSSDDVDKYPCLSTDGTKIAFQSERDGGHRLYSMNVDGSDVRRLTNIGAYEVDPAWSPDGTKIAFASNPDPFIFLQIYVMDTNGANLTRLTHDTYENQVDNRHPAWSPDGTKIAFTSDRDTPLYEPNNYEIYVMDADGNNITRLTLTDCPIWDDEPIWSPDGSKIAFVSDRDGDCEIFVMNADGSNQTQLTNNTHADKSPAWSPDGARIAFTSNVGAWQIFVMNADGSNVTQFTDPDILWGDTIHPSWAIAPSVVTGDANGDGEVNALDITKIERMIAGLDLPSLGADANADGNINALDITKVERLIAGLDVQSSFSLSSSAFQEGQTIPAKYACDGDDVSPPLAWGEPPGATQTFALICDDPDAPVGTFSHWVLFNIPASTRQLPEGIPAQGTLADGSKQGTNDFGQIGYGGPCPPPGPAHHYHFILYALDNSLGLNSGASRQQVLDAMQGHVLAQVELIGLYQH